TVHEDAAHGLGSGGEEVATTVPGLFAGVGRILACHQSQVSLVYQRRGLQRLTRGFVGQPLRGQPAQLIVHQWQQPIGSLGIALLDIVQDAGDLVHARLNGCWAPSWVWVCRASPGDMLATSLWSEGSLLPP